MAYPIMDDTPAAVTSDPITGNLLVTAVCAFFVMFHAFRRYDTPETNRLSTTRSLFLMTGAGYVIASGTLFFIITEIILKPGVLGFIGWPVEQIQTLVSRYSAPPILSAVLLTTLLPNIKFVRDWDAWLPKRFQIWGSIPFGVRNLADELARTESPTEEELAELCAWMLRNADIPSELVNRVSTESEKTARGSLTQTVRFYQAIDKLGGFPAYAKAFRERRIDRQSIREDFRVYAAISQAFFVLFDQLQPLEGSAGANALKQATDRYQEISEKQGRTLAEFVAELLLRVEGSEQRIARRLTIIGLRDLELASLPLPISPLVFMGAVIVAAIFIVMSFLPHPPPQPGTLPTPVVAILVGLTKTIGALAAVLPKLCWSKFRLTDDGRLPHLAWLTWAGVAAVVSLFIERMTHAVFSSSVSILTALDFHRYPVTPIAPTTFVLCIAISVLCDVDLPFGAGWNRRIVEGGICGTAMVTAIFVCFRQLDLPAAATAQISPLFRYGFPFLIGFLCGSVAPYLYRKYRRQNQEEPQSQGLMPRAA